MFFIIPVIIAICVIGGGIVSIVVVAKLLAKATEKIDVKKEAETISNFFSSNPLDKITKKDYKCSYCGNVIPHDKTKCPNCGAKVEKQK